MIIVNNLTKIYNTKEDEPVLALDNVNFKLPDKGMVFVCGKSGSGKSTILNILACLDDFDDGEVIVDGNNLSKLDQNLYDAYRSSLIGFVFQDFHLINNLTVKENIELSLDLISEEKKEIVSYMLDQVGLAGYEDRYPKELSGGQNQRVAIARCLVKNPKYIFADEPTGNLDNTTSIQIFELLKRLSKDRLILVVSHNEQLAYKYGDRIIEIDNGKIIKDVEKNDEVSLIENNIIYMPVNVKLTDEELKMVNEKIKTGEYLISQEDNFFKPTLEDYEEKHTNLVLNKNNSLKHIKNISKTFRKNYALPTIINALIISILLVSLLVAQMFFKFDSNEFINSNSTDNFDFVLYKETKSKDLLSPITDEDIKYFYDNGYTGNVYKLYSFNIPTEKYNHIFDDKYCLPWNKSITYDLAKTPFIIAGKGVLECNIDYLTSIYGTNGKLDVLVGSLEDRGKCELIITDYLADCLKYYRGYNYQQIVDIDMIEMDLSRYRVKAIINTNYQTRYEELITKFQEIQNISDVDRQNDEIEKLKDTNMFIDFYNEMNSYLSVAYFTDGNFIDRVKTDREISQSTWTIYPEFYDLSGNALSINQGAYAYILDETLKPGEARLGKRVFEETYNSDYKETKFPLDLVIKERYLSSKENQVDYEGTFSVKSVVETDMNGIHLSPEDYYQVYDIMLMNYGLYFENENAAKNIYNNNEIQYYTHDVLYNALHAVNKVIVVFSNIFKLINYFILLIITILLINYGRMNIKRKMYEIGVLRSLGVRTKDIFVIIITQVLLMLLIVIGISIIPILTVDEYINRVLLEGFMNYSESRILETIKIIKFDGWIVIKNFLFVLGLTTACSTFLIFMLRKIKPINIIKKDD